MSTGREVMAASGCAVGAESGERHNGQLVCRSFHWSRHRLQKPWPHGVVLATAWSRQIGHCAPSGIRAFFPSDGCCGFIFFSFSAHTSKEHIHRCVERRQSAKTFPTPEQARRGKERCAARLESVSPAYTLYQYAEFSSVLYPGGRSAGSGDTQFELFMTRRRKALLFCQLRQRLPMMPNHIWSEPPM